MAGSREWAPGRLAQGGVIGAWGALGERQASAAALCEQSWAAQLGEMKEILRRGKVA